MISRDLVIGVVVSLAVHSGFATYHLVFNGKQEVKKKEAPPPAIEIIEMPKIEPEEPEVVEASDEPIKPMDFAPPMQTDLPQIITPDSFVQKIQPPPPENVKPATGLISIPENRDTAKFRNMEVFDISKLDKIPTVRFPVKPVYPFEMRRAGIAGEVVVDFLVDTEGKVQNAFAARSSQREFEASAVAAVSKWVFTPGMRGGRKVITHMQVPIVFTLNEE